jgi:hypothetical protein
MACRWAACWPSAWETRWNSLSPTVRSGAFAITYATGVALLGGTTQFVLKLLIDATHNAFAPPLYIIAALAAGMLALTQLRARVTDEARPAELAS